LGPSLDGKRSSIGSKTVAKLLDGVQVLRFARRSSDGDDVERRTHPRVRHATIAIKRPSRNSPGPLRIDDLKAAFKKKKQVTTRWGFEALDDSLSAT
jgi:hypothetical protein